MITYYNPDLLQSELQLEAIHKQENITHICIVDNSAAELAIWNDRLSEQWPKVKYISLGDNKGIAVAQNTGASYLFSKVDSIVFFDQDSLPADNMVASLVKSYEQVSAIEKYNIGGIGPRAINTQTGVAYKAKLKKGIAVAEGIQVTKLTELISSGTLIRKEVWEKTGGMDEALFIDAVDHEWCWRAREKGGYSFFIDETAHLYHALGEGDKKILGINFKGIPKPVRCYYLYRNYLLLVRRSYVPLYWKLMSGCKFSLKFFFYPVFLENGRMYLKYILKGIKDGVAGKGGRVDW
ncbi:glycosyltransferase family 2 protein [Chitinophaga sp. CC14]|nr:glycosyltransferase family 2 protein [Chitinophaga ginsengisegetis]